MGIRIDTERLVLRDFTIQDFDFFSSVERTEYSQRYESDSIPGENEVRDKFEILLDLQIDDFREKYYLLIQLKSSSMPIGKIVVWSIDSDINEWEIGWDTLELFSRRGYTTEAARALIQFAFSTLGAKRIQANCNESNIPSEMLMRKIGMQKEGTLRRQRYLHGEWYGSTIYSILDTDL